MEENPMKLKRFSICKAAFFTSLISLCLFSSETFAQTGTLTGIVKDADTGEILAGANIIVRSVGDRSAATGGAAGDDGVYIVKNLKPGNYFITASFIGYRKTEFTNISISAGRTRTFDIKLKVSAINMDAISVSASRRPEKVLEAPAAVSIITADKIEARNTLTPIDHLKSVPAVDIVQTGLSQSNVVVRGFNNIFSGSLLTLTDNRTARVPSLRFNAFNFIPTTNEDIERVEVVFGPGSALYGPNSANGVLHLITKSPFDSEGTQVSIGGGLRSNNATGQQFDESNSVFTSSFRHASTYNNKLGFKLSGQYYTGRDWERIEPLEPLRLQKKRQTADGPVAVGDTIDNSRDYNIKKLGLSARVDYKLNDDATLIWNAGLNQSSNIDLTGIGAGQAIDWLYYFTQARFIYKDLFLQAFVNANDAGDTFLLNTGDIIADKSKLYVVQGQHSYRMSKRQFFTYGVDLLFTRPNTNNTINGRNEDNDDINEIGAYVQSETDLSDKLRFVAAARIDNHNWLDKPVFSPRAAIVYKPTTANNFRLTYNRAFSTPSANNLFLDIASLLDLGGLGAALTPSLGYNPAIDVRAQGVPQTGFNFSSDANGAQFRSPYARLVGLDDRAFISQHDPQFTNVMWGVASPVVTAGFVAQLRPSLELTLPPAQIDALLASFQSEIIPAQLPGLRNTLAMLDPEDGTFSPFNQTPKDIGRILPTITQTIEGGYKGVIGEKLVINANAYYTKKTNFVGPLIVETPNVFLDQTSLFQALLPAFEATIAASQNPFLTGFLAQLDSEILGGNANGNPADELAAIYAAGAAGIPFGTVTPKEALDPSALIVTYRNFGDIDFFGADFNFTWFVNKNWSFTGNYAYVSKDKFNKSDTQPHDIYLNATKNKAGFLVNYSNTGNNFSGEFRWRFVDEFPMDSGPYRGVVKEYSVYDLNMSKKLTAKTRVSLSINNLFDKKHRQLIGAPVIGRLGLVKFTQSF